MCGKWSWFWQQSYTIATLREICVLLGIISALIGKASYDCFLIVSDGHELFNDCYYKSDPKCISNLTACIIMMWRLQCVRIDFPIIRVCFSSYLTARGLIVTWSRTVISPITNLTLNIMTNIIYFLDRFWIRICDIYVCVT